MVCKAGMGGITPKVPYLALSYPAKNNYNHLEVKSQYPKLITGAKIRVMEKKPKIKRWNRWEKEEKKPKPRELTREEKEKLRQEQQGQIKHATEEKPEEQPIRWEPRGWEPRKLNREVIAKLVAWHLREDQKLKKLAEEIAQKVIIRMLPEITELVISQMVKVIHDAVLKGAKVEIRGIATWRTRNGRIKVRNHIKPKKTP